MTATELVFFTVTGNYLDVEMPDPGGSSNTPAQMPITGLITFYPRVPQGFTAQITNLDLTPILGTSGNTAVAVAPIPARILSGQLQTIDAGDTVGIKLLANSTPITAALNTIPAKWLTDHDVPAGTLIYDIKFSQIVYSSAAQSIENFAITAPSTATSISLTDPTLTRLAYGGP